MNNPEVNNDEIELAELAVIWWENLKIGIVAASIIAIIGCAYIFYKPKTLLISSSIVIGTKLNGAALVGAQELEQILKTRYNVDNALSDIKHEPPYLSKVDANKKTGIVELGVTALDAKSGAALLQTIVNEVLSTYNQQLELERLQASKHVSTIEAYIKQVENNANLKNNVDLSASYNSVLAINTQIANSKPSSTIPTLPTFYSKTKFSLKTGIIAVVASSFIILCLLPLMVGFGKDSLARFKEIRKHRSAL